MLQKEINIKEKKGNSIDTAGIIGKKIAESLKTYPLRAETKAKINFFNERVLNTAQLAFEKAVAHIENPSVYPLPADNKSVECAFCNLLESLPKSKKNKIIDKINQTLKAGSQERASKYKDIVNVNFKSAVTISEQVKSMPFPEEMRFTQEEGNEILKDVIRIAAKPRQLGTAATKISFFVDNMTCLNPDDVRKDEISLGGFSVDSAGNSVDFTPFFVGKFRKNETVLLNDKNKLFTLDLTADVAAQSFTAGLFIIESDWVSNQNIVDKLSILVIALGVLVSVAALALMVISAFVTPVISVATAYLLVLISSSLSAIGYQFIPLIGDDISFDTTDTLLIEGTLNIGDTFERTLQIGKGFDISNTFDGKYTAAARWVAEA